MPCTLKTQGFHWNVAGPMFYSLHKRTEEQYSEMADAIDELAKRIRAIGFPAPASFDRFIEMTQIKQERGVPSAEKMIEQLAACVKRYRTCGRFCPLSPALSTKGARV